VCSADGRLDRSWYRSLSPHLETGLQLRGTQERWTVSCVRRFEIDLQGESLRECRIAGGHGTTQRNGTAAFYIGELTLSTHFGQITCSKPVTPPNWVLRTGAPIYGHWRPHPIGHEAPVEGVVQFE
jgi:hypothetical protein